MIRAALPLGAVLLAATAGQAQAPLPAPPGLSEVHREASDPGRYALPIRPAGAAEGSIEPLEGAILRQSFRGADTTTPLAAIRALSEPLEAEGFVIALDCEAAACGGFDFRQAITVLPQPAMALNIAAFHQRTLRRDAGLGETTAVSLLASRLGGQTHVQAVQVAGAAAPPPAELPTTPPALSQAPSQAVSPAPGAPLAAPDDPVAALWQRLSTSGRAVLEGIGFDTAAETVPAADSLAHLAALMAERPELRLAVVGHSDGVGALEPNLRLSRARAAAVVAALVALGVSADRLEAAGAAWLAPLAANATETGRARNRRVEIVLR